MTAMTSTLEPFFPAWLLLLMGGAPSPDAQRGRGTGSRTSRGPSRTRRAPEPMGLDRQLAGRRMRVGVGYCGTVELTGRFTRSPHTEVPIYEDTEGRLHYLANLRPVTGEQG